MNFGTFIRQQIDEDYRSGIYLRLEIISNFLKTTFCIGVGLNVAFKKFEFINYNDGSTIRLFIVDNG